jgi:hypothetical protein
MKTTATALLFALAAAACTPAEEGIATAHAQQSAATGGTVVAYPQVGEGAADGQVYEYY